MIPLIRTLSAPLLSLVFMMAASGLFNTFVSIRLEMEGFSPEEIGIVTASQYVGILLGSLWLDRWISKMGHVRSFLFFVFVLVAVVAVQAFWIHSLYWSALRLIGGISTAGVFIVIESWLLMQSGPALRGAALSLYLAVFYAALSGGQFLLNLSDPKGFSPFGITAAFLLCSMLPIATSKKEKPKLEKEAVRLKFTELVKLSPLGFVGGIISGMLLAALYGFLPLYAKYSGLSTAAIGPFMATLIFGGFSLQWPFGKLADKGHRRMILTLSSFATTLIALAIPTLSASGWSLFLLVALLGAFSFTLYPLSMAYACEKAKESQIVAITGGFVLSYGIGAIGGPLLAPIAMELFGPAGLFYFLALITFGLGVFGLKRQKAPIIEE